MKRNAPPQASIVLALLMGFSFISYLLRVNISVAAEMMMPDLGLNAIQMGQVFSSFLVGYAIFQIPAGALGDTVGPRLVLGIAVLLWGFASIATGLVGHSLWMGTEWVVVSLCAIRFILGAGEAATFPIGASVVYKWLPRSQHARGNSLLFTGSALGAALASPLVSWLMLKTGWRGSFFITSMFAFASAPLWMWYVKDRRSETRDVKSPSFAELGSEASLQTEAIEPKSLDPEAIEPKSVWRIMADGNIVLLTLSYVCEGYVLFIFVFWLYLYLVNVRGFSILKGGFMSALPWLTASVMTPFGGVLCDKVSARTGRLAGSRITIAIGYSLTGVLLLVAAGTPSRIASVTALCLSIGCLMGSEASFWSAASLLGGERSGTIGGLMNTTGVLGGILSTSLVPVLVAHFGWTAALGSGTAMALACPLLWVMIGREQRIPSKN